MSTSTNNINVTVSGADEDGVNLISDIINTSLQDAGFSNSTVVNAAGEPVPSDDVPSMLDLMRQNNPAFFDSPVVITPSYESPDSDDDDDNGNGQDPEYVIVGEMTAVVSD